MEFVKPEVEAFVCLSNVMKQRSYFLSAVILRVHFQHEVSCTVSVPYVKLLSFKAGYDNGILPLSNHQKQREREREIYVVERDQITCLLGTCFGFKADLIQTKNSNLGATII